MSLVAFLINTNHDEILMMIRTGDVMCYSDHSWAHGLNVLLSCQNSSLVTVGTLWEQRLFHYLSAVSRCV